MSSADIYILQENTVWGNSNEYLQDNFGEKDVRIILIYCYSYYIMTWVYTAGSEIT